MLRKFKLPDGGFTISKVAEEQQHTYKTYVRWPCQKNCLPATTFITRQREKGTVITIRSTERAVRRNAVILRPSVSAGKKGDILFSRIVATDVKW